MKKKPLSQEEKRGLRDLAKVRLGNTGRYFLRNLLEVAVCYSVAVEMIENAVNKSKEIN